MSDATVHLFSNGFEYDCWEEANCDRCPRDLETCSLNIALFTDTPGGGPVKPETAERLGYTDAYLGVLGWPCKERLSLTMKPKPAALEMAQAGAMRLPGFDVPEPRVAGGGAS